MNVASRDCAEPFFAGRVSRCTHLDLVSSLPELRRLLESRQAAAASPTTLDLIGHSTRHHHLLRLGDTAIDMLDPGVARFFRVLARDTLLAGLGVTAVRLLGCETAVTDSGQRTLRMLARIVGVPVYGTLVPLLKSHYNTHGFNSAFGHLLAESSA
jgi:hypothetical protein